MKPSGTNAQVGAAAKDGGSAKDRDAAKDDAAARDSGAAKSAAAAKDDAATTRRPEEKVRGEPADFGGPQPREDQAERQGFDRQRLEPQDQPPADVLDRGNLAGEKDFELGPGGKA